MVLCSIQTFLFKATWILSKDELLHKYLTDDGQHIDGQHREVALLMFNLSAAFDTVLLYNPFTAQWVNQRGGKV